MKRNVLVLAVVFGLVLCCQAAMARGGYPVNVGAQIRVLDVVKGMESNPRFGSVRIVVNEVIVEIVSILPVQYTCEPPSKERREAVEYLQNNKKQITLRVACPAEKNDDLAAATSGKAESWKGVLKYNATIEVSKMEMPSPRTGNPGGKFSVMFVPVLADYWPVSDKK